MEEQIKPLFKATPEQQQRFILSTVDSALKALLDDEGLCFVIYKRDGIPTVTTCEKNKLKL